MPQAVLPTGITLEYDTLGSPNDPALLLVMGFTAQMIAWPDGFCQALVDQGFHVIRFDNRDCGLSTKLDGQVPDLDGAMAAAFSGTPAPAVPYTLSDMAADAVGLLDHLAIDAAHVVGASMGGMIAQTIAIEHPTRTASLTSIMSMTGEIEFGSPTPEAAEVLLAAPSNDRDTYIADSVRSQVWSSKRYFDPDETRAQAARAFDRSFYPEGATRQLAAIYASGSRAEGLAGLTMPSLVIHGRDDTLITPDGGKRTAELIPGATLVLAADMGHDLPTPLWPLITGAIAANSRIGATLVH
jgi:pimeloyl-ACP methyl ester carboxylesterase